MRPLEPNPPIIEAPTYTATLVATRGAYCAICERPLISEAWVWDSVRGTTLSPHGPELPAIEDGLLVCADCERSQALAEPFQPGELALPNRTLTFFLDDQSLFRYELVETTIDIVDDEGSVVTKDGSFVFVRPTTEEAARTIGVFQLNGVGWDADSHRLSVSRHDWLGLIDQRVRLRTEVWTEAERFVQTVTDGEMSPLDVIRYRKVVEASGFPSVWATVIAQLDDRDLLSRLLGLTDEDEQLLASLPRAVVSTVGASPFPGTDWRWLFPWGGSLVDAGSGPTRSGDAHDRDPWAERHRGL